MPSTPEFDAFRATLEGGGLHSALAYLNSRTPHRFTGVYRYDGDMLRNMALVDRFDLSVRQGDDVPMGEAYCAIVSRAGGQLEIVDGRTDGRFPWMAESPVVCYCGVLITTAAGDPFGTLCHYDVQHCQMRTSDLPLLKAAAPLIWAKLEGRVPA